MKNILTTSFLLLTIFVFAACSDSPSSKQRDEQFEIINDNVKNILGDDYEAQNFNVSEEGYSNEEKTSYVYKFKFDLNKPYLIFQGKNIPGELQFDKNTEGEWECNFNSANAMGLLNLIKL